jgi:hypothetical protein
LGAGQPENNYIFAAVMRNFEKPEVRRIHRLKGMADSNSSGAIDEVFARMASHIIRGIRA